MIKSLQEELLTIESELFPLVESTEGGSKTTKADGYKITVKRPINRTIDGEAWDAVKDTIPSEMWPVRVKIEPDPKGCEWLAHERPDMWAVAAKAITEREGKAGFTIEAIDD
jgi:hypothetical protein